ncbi:MAG: hypothetical protein IPK60_10925 [Sandaracinaceae bacterium]|nr:hypothetical protein [Sandaracinaceae bacterium]
MDVNELKSWTREKLEGALAARGVSGVEFLTRTELVNLLTNRNDGARTPLAIARSLLRTLVERTFPAEVTAPAARPRAATTATSADDVSLVSASGEPSETSSTVASPAPDDEPIQTRTMARLLANQGHQQRALAIYARLLQASPNDSELRAERDELATTGALSLDTDYASDSVEVTRTHPTSLFIRWELSHGGVKRAAALHAGAATLTVRVVSIEADEHAVVTTHVREFTAEGRVGERLISEIAPHAICLVAVGIGEGDSFVSIAHTAEPLQGVSQSN